MKHLLFAIIAVLLLSVTCSASATPAGDIQITGVTSNIGSSPEPGSFRLALHAVGPDGLEYRFFSRAGYDLIAEGWGGTKWVSVQDFSPVTWADYALSESDQYYASSHVVAAGESWESGDPQGGFSVLTADGIKITSVTSDLETNPHPGDTFRVTVEAVPPEGVTLHYRFFFRAGYDLIAEGWGGTKWETVQDFSPVNWFDYTLPESGHYYLIVHVIAEGETWEAGDPQGGFSVFAPLPMAIAEAAPIAAGGGHAVALNEDGTLSSWGDNYYGQLGDGTVNDRRIPVKVLGISSVAAVAAGRAHTVALKEDGTVWAWGNNEYGQLGNPQPVDRYAPHQVSGLFDAVAITAGDIHTVALQDDGTVWAWGNNEYGQLGDGTTTESNTPVQVSGLTDVVAISAGAGHTVALRGDGTVWAWGWNFYGQLGDDGMSGTSSITPVQVLSLSNIAAVSTEGAHTLAITREGVLWAWGGNRFGQLGDGTVTDRHVPVELAELSGFVDISAGAAHNTVLHGDGTLWSWGDNEYGQLGNGTTTGSKTPVPVAGLSDIVEVSAGVTFTLALAEDGTVWAWGNNEHGQLGDGSTVDSSTPVQVSGL